MGSPWLDAAWAAYAASKGEQEAGALWQAMERWARTAHIRFFKRPCPDTALDIVALGWEKLDQFDSERGGFTNWFSALCFNELKRLYKQHRREVSIEGIRPIGYEPAWMHRGDLEQKLVDLWQQGCSWAEMGQALGLDAGLVRHAGLGAALREAE